MTTCDHVKSEPWWQRCTFLCPLNSVRRLRLEFLHPLSWIAKSFISWIGELLNGDAHASRASWTVLQRSLQAKASGLATWSLKWHTDIGKRVKDCSPSRAMAVSERCIRYILLPFSSTPPPPTRKISSFAVYDGHCWLQARIQIPKAEALINGE